MFFLNAFGLPDFYVVAATLGMVGQMLRGLLGYIKRVRGPEPSPFRPGHYFSTAVLGALSGLIGSLVYDLQGMTPTMVSPNDLMNDRNFILMAVASGYFGADVIEGVLARHAPAGR